MSLPDGNCESLLRYSQRMMDQVTALKRQPLRPVAAQILQEFASRACARYVGLMLVRSGRNGNSSSGSVFAEWTSPGMKSVLSELQNVNLSYFGLEARQSLLKGEMIHTKLNASGVACSRLVSGLLRELETSSLDLIPIMLQGQLKAILLISHHGDGDYYSYSDRLALQHVSKCLYLGLRSVRHNRRRQREHRQWKRIANGTCDFVLRLDRHLEVIDAVPFGQKHLPAVKGLPVTEFATPGSHDVLLERIETAVQSGTPRTLEIRAIDGNHRLCSYSVRIEPGNGKTRHFATLYLTNNDIERAHTEELNALKSQLDRATRLSLLGQLATEFAHQLTQPLQAVLNKCYTLKNRIENPEASEEDCLEVVDGIEGHVKHANDIIHSLRDFLQNRPLKLAPVCVATMIEHSVTMVIPPSDDDNAKITIRDPHGLSQVKQETLVYVDRVHTTHVFLNLLVNAMEACLSAQTVAPEVTVSTSFDSEGFVLVEISDNGPGIKRENPDSVFERFFSTKQEGFGIGLAICRDVIERQGGSIHVRNNDGPGCCFYFTLPLYTGFEDDDIIEEAFDPEVENDPGEETRLRR